MHSPMPLAELGIPKVRGGTYLVMEGPQFSTLAESRLYRAWGCDVIGMTNMPEAKLAREAELCYATVGMVTDYDCWHADYARVTVAADRRSSRTTPSRRARLSAAVVAKLAGARLPSSRLPHARSPPR